ncbi:MAG: 4-(cytidine 5'-diphospho)-2-C-methyl-D-erythritol kinase, partial [Pseudomonadota bacterium]
MTAEAAARDGGLDGAAPEGRVAELARAKVNLHLHVLGRREDGRHLLDSLAVFPELGDLIEVEPARALSLSVDGPFRDQLGAGADNLVLRAAELLRAKAPGAPGAAIRLVKHLPVASGIGGGSADAAAALRALNRLWKTGLSAEALARMGEALGADVPVCVRGPRASLMGGIGEVLRPAPPLPKFWMALANPGVPVATAEVFRRLSRRDGAAAAPPAEGFATAEALAKWLAAQENFLEAPAVEIAPAVAETRAALGAAEGCLLARMSGSGATCFGIFAEEPTALAAAEAARARGWWAAAGP